MKSAPYWHWIRLQRCEHRPQYTQKWELTFPQEGHSTDAKAGDGSQVPSDLGFEFFWGYEVHVSADGTVVDVGEHTGLGRSVAVDHGFGITTVYGHLSGYATQPGARVKRGEVVGYVGTSGRASGPHVHFEVRMYGTPVNPWKFLRGAASGD